MKEADIVIGFPFYNEIASNNIANTVGGKVDVAKLVEDLAAQAKKAYPDKRIAIIAIGESKGKGKDYFKELDSQLKTKDIESENVKVFKFMKAEEFGGPEGKKWAERALLKISKELN